MPRFLGFFLAALCVAPAWAAPVTLIESGVPQGCILVPADAPDTVYYAAEELRSHLARMSNAELTVVREGEPAASRSRPVVSIGETEFANRHAVAPAGLAPDGYRLCEAGGALVIVGRDHHGPPLGDRRGRLTRSYNPQMKISAHGETGTLFGVYHFLRDLGFRWYLPGDIGAVVPRSLTVVFDGAPVENAPYYTYRKFHGFNFRADPEAAVWYKRVGFGSVRYINANHSFTDWVERFGETHPEYFAIIDGKRHSETVRDKGRVILCFSEPGVLEQVVKDAQAYFDANPDEPIFAVVPNDSFSKPCECERCQAELNGVKRNRAYFSDLVWGFVDQVAAEVYKSHPERYIACLSYSSQMTPPFRLEKFSTPNVAVMQCRKRLNFWDQGYKDHVYRGMKRWKEMGAARFYLWEYYNMRSRSVGYQHVPDVAPHLIAEDLAVLKDYSQGEFIEAEQNQQPSNARVFDKRGMSHLNLYVTARCLWNPDLDVDALLDEYYRVYYGPAAEAMKRFFTLLEERWSQPQPGSTIDPKGDVTAIRGPWHDLYPYEVVERLFRNLDQAAAKTGSQTPYGSRVAYMRSEFEPMWEYAKATKGIELVTAFACPRVEASPELDGRLGDEAWKKTDPPLFLVEQVAGARPTVDTHWWAARDDKYFYLAARCFEPEMDRIRSFVKEEDGFGIWWDDAVELFLDVNHDRATAYQFIANCAGARFDVDARGDRDWDSGFRAATGREEKAWTIEIAIPFEALGGPPEAGAQWGINLTRDRVLRPEASFNEVKRDYELYSWSPTFGASGAAARFGTVTFE